MNNTFATTAWIDANPAVVRHYAVAGPISLVITLISSIIIICIFIKWIIRIQKLKVAFKRSDIICAFMSILGYLCYSLQYFSLSIYGVINNDKSTFHPNICLFYYHTPFWYSTGRLFSYLFFLSYLIIISYLLNSYRTYYTYHLQN